MTDFNDLPDDSDFDAIIAAPRKPVTDFAGIVPVELFNQPCGKCRGTGHFIGYSGRSVGQCFTCKGTGKQTFKTSPQTRAKAATRKADNKAEKIEAFKAEHADVWAWMNGNDFPFAVAMVEALNKWGALTDRQLAACVSCVQKRNAGKAAAVARVQNAVALDVAPLEAAFAKAGASLKTPRLTVAGFVVSPAKATSANAGALYVKSNGTYLGKIMGGKFITSRDCDADTESKFRAVAADPKGAAIAHGKLTGNCACCGRTLTNKESIELGIGPICAGKWF